VTTILASRTADGLQFDEDERGVGISGLGLRSFLVETTLEPAVAAYQKAVRAARELFEARAPGSPLVDPVARQATLDMLYFYAVNRLPLEVPASDWESPATWRIIQSLVEKRHPPLSPGAVAECARLMGISEPAYLHWRESDELFAMR
jgi:hypothetical protein